MAYAYCPHCCSPVREPTLGELLDETQRCDACRNAFTPTGAVTDALEALERRVNWLCEIARAAGLTPPD